MNGIYGKAATGLDADPSFAVNASAAKIGGDYSPDSTTHCCTSAYGHQG